MSLLMGPHVSHWPSTLLVAAHPFEGIHLFVLGISLLDFSTVIEQKISTGGERKCTRCADSGNYSWSRKLWENYMFPLL